MEQTLRPANHIRLIETPESFLQEQATPITEFRIKYSRTYHALSKELDETDIPDSSLDDETIDLWSVLSEKENQYENAILYYFWGIGVTAAVTELNNPDRPLTDDPVLLQRIMQPEIPNLENLKHIVLEAEKCVEERLDSDQQKKMQKRCKIKLQLSWEIRHYALVSGYEWAMVLLKDIGYTGNAENLAWLYQLLD